MVWHVAMKAVQCFPLPLNVDKKLEHGTSPHLAERWSNFFNCDADTPATFSILELKKQTKCTGRIRGSRLNRCQNLDGKCAKAPFSGVWYDVSFSKQQDLATAKQNAHLS